MKGFDSISTEDKERLALTGIQTDSMEGRAGSFLLVNDHVLHAGSNAEGVEVMMIDKALEKYAWLADYCWNVVPCTNGLGLVWVLCFSVPPLSPA